MVSVAGSGMVVAKRDNEDGTWNIEFNDGTDGDAPSAQITREPRGPDFENYLRSFEK